MILHERQVSDTGSCRLFLCIFLCLMIPCGSSADEISKVTVILNEEDVRVLQGEPIVSIRFEGEMSTDEAFLLRHVLSCVGCPFNHETVQADEQRLRNLGIFSKVTAAINRDGEGIEITVSCQELITILPIVNFGAIRETVWFQLGVVDYHWLGRGFTLGAYYRYYDLHSFQAFAELPYLWKSFGLSSVVGRFSTIEPAYFGEEQTIYNVDRWETSVTGLYNFSTTTRLDIGVSRLQEIYEKNNARSNENSPGPAKVDFTKFLVKSALSIDHVDYYFYLLEGWHNELTVEAVRNNYDNDVFWKVLNIWSGYHRVGEEKNHNIAARIRAGICENVDSPFVPFVLDSYVNARGSGDRVARGTAELTVNLEYRQTLRDHRTWAVQGVTFVDWSAWRPSGGELSDMLKSDNIASFAGIGVRFYYQKLYNLILRLDYGISLYNENQHGPVLGSGQYF